MMKFWDKHSWIYFFLLFLSLVCLSLPELGTNSNQQQTHQDFHDISPWAGRVRKARSLQPFFFSMANIPEQMHSMSKKVLPRSIPLSASLSHNHPLAKVRWGHQDKACLASDTASPCLPWTVPSRTSWWWWWWSVCRPRTEEKVADFLYLSKIIFPVINCMTNFFSLLQTLPTKCFPADVYLVVHSHFAHLDFYHFLSNI